MKAPTLARCVLKPLKAPPAVRRGTRDIRLFAAVDHIRGTHGAELDLCVGLLELINDGHVVRVRREQAL